MGTCQRDILATNLKEIPVAKAERILINKIAHFRIISHSTNIHEPILIQMNKQMWRKRQLNQGVGIVHTEYSQENWSQLSSAHY